MQSIKRAPATEGPIFSKMILFALPIMLTGILQLLYNSADSIIIGRFSGDPNALGAVGSAGSVTNLLVNMLMGLGAGTSVLISQFYGAKNDSAVSRSVHTSLLSGFISGVLILIIGQFISAPLLRLLGTKSDLFYSANLYTRIIFLGVPALALFNFGAAILRSLGDSRTPLIILSLSGILNVLLNLLFVITFDMSVAGVALATIISQYASAIIILLVLSRVDGPHKFSFKRLRIDRGILARILKVAIPSAIQSSFFSISNMLLQSSVNTFTTDEVSGSAIAGTVEGYSYTILNSFYTVSLTFVGQNFGANKIKRTKRVLFFSLLQVTVVGVVVGSVMTIFAEQISMIFIDPNASNTAAVVTASLERLSIVLIPYTACGYMDVFTGFLRGYGYSFLTMMSSLVCICVVRVVWTQTVFKLDAFNSIQGLFIVYPISWILASLTLGTMSFIVYRKKLKKQIASNENLQPQNSVNTLM